MLAAVLFLPVGADAVSARRAYAVDAVSGRVLYEKNPTERSLIASTTKIMTALIVCEQCNVLDRMRIPKEAVGIEGSSMYLKEGEVLTLQELLYGLMLSSGNDAAVALAIYCGGTVEGFAELMNDKAHNLGLTGTHFENPNGLDSPGHYSTAKDLGTLAAYAMENPIFYKTVSAKNVKVGDRYLTNHNKLLWRVAGADGVKTGFTKAAGRILVSSATRDGRRIIVVTIDDPSDWSDHAALMEEGFSRYAIGRIVNQGDRVGSVEVVGGEKRRVEVLAAEDFDYSVAPGGTPLSGTARPGVRLCPGSGRGGRRGRVRADRGQGCRKSPGRLRRDHRADPAGGKELLEETIPQGERLTCRSRTTMRGGKTMTERLQKILSARGMASRRKAEELIRAGQVSVNGVTATLGDCADPETDDIRVAGQPLAVREKNVYILLNKPRGYVTTLSDERGRPDVAGLVADCGVRVYPVGRLDMDSEGLLLLTNDGAFANALMHPKHEVEKTYDVWVTGYMPGGERRLAKPITLDGYTIRSPKVKLLKAEGQSAKFRVTIHEGRNRQVRRMCDAAGMHCTRLRRIQEGSLRLGDLPLGKWRYLTEAEVAGLVQTPGTSGTI